jgi:hypothetical protein
MNFKQLINHYHTLSKDQLVEKLAKKNTLILEQENEIERLTKELKDLREIEQDHKQMNGELKKQLDEIKEKK